MSELSIPSISESKFIAYYVTPWLNAEGYSYQREYVLPQSNWTYRSFDFLATDPQGQVWVIEVKPDFGKRERPETFVSNKCKRACQQVNTYHDLYVRAYPHIPLKTMLVVPSDNLTAAELTHMKQEVDRVVTLTIGYTYPFLLTPTGAWLQADPVMVWKRAYPNSIKPEDYPAWRKIAEGRIPQEHLTYYDELQAWRRSMKGGQS